MAVKTPITELDFDGIKAQFRTYLQNQTKFKDYDFEGSNMSVLLDVLSYNTFMNNFYTNMAINEMFLDSALLRNSIISHAKELNYLPRSRRSARAVVRITINDPQGVIQGSTYSIPQYSEFTTTVRGTNYTFVTDKVHLARKTSPGVFQSDEITIYEGEILTSFEREGFIVDDDGVLRVNLKNDTVDTETMEVFVDAEQTDDQNVYTRANDVFGVGPTDKVFYVEPYFDNTYSVYFGNNVFGQQPEPQEDVRVRYRATSGAEANGASSFAASFIDDASITVTTVTAAYGGLERESIESIRYFAPKSLQIQERAVTSRDYEVLLRQNFPEINSVAAYGGEDLNPPQYGRVAISVYLGQQTPIVSNRLSRSYVDYLRDKSPLGIEPIFVQTQFVYADVTIKVYYSKKFSALTADDIEIAVRNAVQQYSTDELDDFNKTLRLSKVSGIIDDLDESIQSSGVFAMPIIEWNPTLNIVTNPTFKFESLLSKPYPFRQANGFTEYKPAIRSSTFDVENGVCVYLQDDGLGNIQVVTDDPTAPQILNPSVGTVDYTTGEVNLFNITVEAYPGAAIKIMARTARNDVVAPKGRVFVIRDEDVKVEVYDEESLNIRNSTTSTPYT